MGQIFFRYSAAVVLHADYKPFAGAELYLYAAAFRGIAHGVIYKDYQHLFYPVRISQTIYRVITVHIERYALTLGRRGVPHCHIVYKLFKVNP